MRKAYPAISMEVPKATVEKRHVRCLTRRNTWARKAMEKRAQEDDGVWRKGVGA